MISLKISNVKNFMSKLLIKDTFDEFLISEGTISTATTVDINGQINKDFYNKEELEEFKGNIYAPWSKLRPFCFELIKGNKTPSFLKIVFILPNETTAQLIENKKLNFSLDVVNGLYLNIKYSNGSLSCITGSSIKVFTMDKSLEQAFDDYVQEIFLKKGIDFELL